MKSEEFVNTVSVFQDKIFRLSLRLLKSRDAAQDSTQDILMKLWKMRKKFDKYKNIEAYAMTMTKNHCYDQLKLKNNNNISLVHSNFALQHSGLETALEAKEEMSIVARIIEKLPEQERAVIQLRDIEQYNNKEIEDILEMNPTSVRVAISRGRKKIKEELMKIKNYGL
ncbi:RNA polymerase sigma factor [Psychroflexus aestuariivivens]|uniref:RNA polymerase sigma factor n=1 Tax=Psychroflexus aestuariivivens TaxID=1795040 RepID=UPI000FD9A729|nr:RNA polymerase sigma factor [Psychroflexus aestuariivivens]